MLKTILNRPIPFFYFLFIVLAVSVFKFLNMPVALYPNVSQPSLRIVSWSGELNNLIYYEKYGQRFEEKLLAINEVVGVQSDYYNGYRGWDVDFDWNVELDEAKRLMKEAVSSFEASLPDYLRNTHVREKGGNSNRLLLSVNTTKTSAKDAYNFITQKYTFSLQI